jgi:hypothetical protein
MAKFSRFDSRNKKSGKHKQQSQERDFKIKNVQKTKNSYVQQTKNMVEYKYNDEGVFYEQPRQSDIDRLRRRPT